MPIYVFKNPETDEVKELVQKMSESHTYTDKDGLEWQRVWLPSNFNIDGTVSPWSPSSFSESAEGKNYTLGEMWDRSAEMSKAREEKEGKDPVKEKWLKNYSKKRRGAKYSEDGNLLSGGGNDLNVEITD